MLPVGSAGDVHPFVGIGIALKARGHEVSIITNPHFSPVVTRAGLRLVPFGTVDQFDRLTKQPDLWHRDRGMRVISSSLREHMPMLYQTIVNEVRHGSQAMVGHALALAAGSYRNV